MLLHIFPQPPKGFIPLHPLNLLLTPIPTGVVSRGMATKPIGNHLYEEGLTSTGLGNRVYSRFIHSHYIVTIHTYRVDSVGEGPKSYCRGPSLPLKRDRYRPLVIFTYEDCRRLEDPSEVQTGVEVSTGCSPISKHYHRYRVQPPILHSVGCSNGMGDLVTDGDGCRDHVILSMSIYGEVASPQRVVPVV